MNRTCAALLTCFVWAALFSGCASTTVRPRPLATLEEEADAAFRAGNYARAVSYDTEIIQRTGGSYRAYLHRALSYQFGDQPGEALEDFGRAIDIRPNAPLGRLYRGSLNLQLGNVDAATSDVNALLRMGGERLTAYEKTILLTMVGLVSAHEGRAEKALDSYERAISLARSHPEVRTEAIYRDALYNAAEVCYALARFGHAREYMRRYAKAKEQEGLPITEEESYLLGLLAYMTENFDEAREHFRNVSAAERERAGKLLGDERFFSTVER